MTNRVAPVGGFAGFGLLGVEPVRVTEYERALAKQLQPQFDAEQTYRGRCSL